MRLPRALGTVAYFTTPFIAFAAATGVAAAAGLSLGRAATVGAIVFAVSLVVVLLRDPAPSRG